MAVSDFERIFAALNEREVRYIVMGGVAVVLHGYPRMTADLDLFIDFENQNVENAFDALASLGYKPRVPVKAALLSDAATRAGWVNEKSMVVLSFWSDQQPLTEVDVFVDEPLRFSDAFERSYVVELETTTVRILGLSDLIAEKRRTARPKDLDDAEALEEVRRREHNHEP